MNALLLDPTSKERWASTREPGHEITERAAESFLQTNGQNRNVLNCAIPLARAMHLTDFNYPVGWDLDKCLKSCGNGYFAEGLNSTL